jgi:RsiW-degrading membrane proteinase PrsW (M82 family)
MSINFVCGCGKSLRARDELAGKKTRCPECSAILTIPAPEVVEPAPAQSFTDEDGLPYGLADPEPVAPSRSLYEDETALRPSTPSTFQPSPRLKEESRPRPYSSAKEAAPKAKGRSGGDGSLLEYSYLLLAFALIPLTFSLLGKEEKNDISERLTQTIDRASPEDQKRIEGVLSRGEVTREEMLAALPGGKLHGAHLAHDSALHWVYAAIAATGFLLLLSLFFSVERAQALHLLGIGAFTGTVGIVFLLLVQLCSGLRRISLRGGGWVALIMLILVFIGWSYDSANDPDSNFVVSALGFTFGVGLCEEFTKAIPIFFYFKRDAKLGWRGACLWGLASGIGFGVSEGIMYSARDYNGICGVDIYLVRFVSCVALHAMWSASVGIAIARNVEDYEAVEDGAGFGVFLLRVMAVPMVLHGLYDTLLKQDMSAGALLIALLSFAWLAVHIEMARGSHPGAGRLKRARKAMA